MVLAVAVAVAVALLGASGSVGGTTWFRGSPEAGASVPQALAIVSAAASQRGVHSYCWAGGGPSGPTHGQGHGHNEADDCGDPSTVGYDCAGLVIYALSKASGGSIALPRPSQTQGADYARYGGTLIRSRSDLEPGDVVFLGGGSMSAALHEGIYAGNGLMWDADTAYSWPGGSYPNGVFERSLANEESQYSFDGAVRFGSSSGSTVDAGSPSSAQAKPKERQGHIGETLRLNAGLYNFAATAEDVIDPAHGVNGSAPRPGYRFVAVPFRIENLMTVELAGVALSDTSIVGSDKKVYTPTSFAVAECANDKESVNNNINFLGQGQTATGCVVFQVPSHVHVAAVMWSPSNAGYDGAWLPTRSTPSISGAPSGQTVLNVPLGPYRGMKPQSIQFSGDATNVVSHITWHSWTPTLAEGVGTWDYLTCDPSCADGTSQQYSATIELTEPQNGVFTAITETTAGPHGFTARYSYRTAGHWPTYAAGAG